MTAWNEFILAATFMNRDQLHAAGGPAPWSASSPGWGYFAAGAILVRLPVVALFLRLQKNLVGGLTAGGVKG